MKSFFKRSYQDIQRRSAGVNTRFIDRSIRYKSRIRRKRREYDGAIRSTLTPENECTGAVYSVPRCQMHLTLILKCRGKRVNIRICRTGRTMWRNRPQFVPTTKCLFIVNSMYASFPGQTALFLLLPCLSTLI